MRVLVATGSSGGHIFPALSFLQALEGKRKGIDVLLALPKKSIKNRLPKSTFKIKYISISAVRLKWNFKNLLNIFEFLKGSLESLFLLLEFRPHIVVGFGTLSSVPLVIFAWLFRTKTLIHEQNVIPGRANRLLARFVDKIAVSFRETTRYLKDDYKITLTGNPIRKEFLKEINRAEALNFFGFSEDKFTILVMGGSQGSHKINLAFSRAISSIPDNLRFQVIHISGADDYDLLKDSYRKFNLSIKLFSFLEDMRYAYSVSGLAVCRAGAGTIGELIFFGLPAIIIPYPFAYKHQSANAQVLAETGSAIVIEDDKLNAGILKDTLTGLLNNPARINLMHSSYSSIFKPDAASLLADLALSLN